MDDENNNDPLRYLNAAEVQAAEWIKDEIRLQRKQHPDRFDLVRVEWGPSGIERDPHPVPGVLARRGEFRNAVRARPDSLPMGDEPKTRDFARRAMTMLRLWVEERDRRFGMTIGAL